MGLWLGCWLSLYMSAVTVLFNESIWLTHYQILPHMGRFYMDAHIRLTWVLQRNCTALKWKEHKMKRKEKNKQINQGHLNEEEWFHSP